jgi:hypothetical protein
MFKFYTIPDLKTLENIIGVKPTLKFSSAFNLNDPFELKFNLLLDPFAEGQFEEFLKVHPGKTSEDFKEWQGQVENNKGFVWYTEQEQRATISKLITICSFTEKNNNNLMWSHYTDNHRGICVEYSDSLFDSLKMTEGFPSPGFVSIIKESPVACLHATELLKDMILYTKVMREDTHHGVFNCSTSLDLL